MRILSDRIYTADGLKKGSLRIRDGKFAEINNDAGPEGIDYSSYRIIPGIIDTHIHGTNGYSLMGRDEAEEAENVFHLKGFLKGCASQGITSVFPTAFGGGMVAATARLAKSGDYEGAEIMGIHCEGPWLSRAGEKGIRTPWPKVDMKTAEKLVQDADGLLKLVALAPEIPGIDPIIEYFLSQGVVLANAHSDNYFEEATESYNKKGLSVSTHTGNVMTGLHHRDIGGLGAALLNDNVMCEVICDGMHICLEMLEIFFRLKDYSRFMMVSDCTPYSGAPEGEYPGWDPSMTIHVTPQGFVLSDTGRLCGSSQPVLYGIRNLVEKLHIPMETVIQMSSLNAARKYGFADRKGSIEAGKDADFAVLTDDYKVVATYVRGQKVFDAKEDTQLFNQQYLS